MPVRIIVVAVLILGSSACLYAQGPGFAFREDAAKKQLDVLYNGKLLTAYCYYDSVMKPVLFPLNTVSGITITRGYPLDSRPGERVDHPHHIGLWLNYQDVEGLDFWNNSTAIKYDRRPRYGTIYHDKLITKEASGDKAVLEVQALWKNHSNELLLTETTTYQFSVKGSDFIIDRTTSLKASAGRDIPMHDIKDGFLAIRVARELELPSDESAKVVDADGGVKEVKLSNEGVTGNYVSSEGLEGNDVWGTRATWVTLTGKKDNKDISVTIIDHPDNPGYPAYWHARGYGLFAVNPLGQAAFSDGRERLNLEIKKDESVTFRYRVIIHEGMPLTSDQVNAMTGF